MSNHFKSIDKHVKQINKTRERIIELIENLPDNDKIERLGSNAFILNFKELNSRSWSPQYYDFKYQYKEFAKTLKRKWPENLQNYIEETLKKGWFNPVNERSYGFYYNVKILLHHEVANNIKSLLNLK